MLSHPNVVTLKHYFHQKGEKEEEMYLNLVLEYMPDTVYSINTQYAKAHSMLPPIIIKVRLLVLPLTLWLRRRQLHHPHTRPPLPRSCLCTKCAAPWRTCTASASATATSSRKTCWWTTARAC